MGLVWSQPGNQGPSSLVIPFAAGIGTHTGGNNLNLGRTRVGVLKAP